ncbi:MAG: TIGR02996 domain-containing protein [Proteobacteria bacterium]|nr:TIGR02996 domain-containing protein [Pseudomonadota bacterium]
MNEEQNLRAAVVQKPFSFAPRLVYADWIEANGDPERARLIRTQIQLSQVPIANEVGIRGRRATEADSKHRFPVLKSRPTEPRGPGANREIAHTVLIKLVQQMLAKKGVEWAGPLGPPTQSVDFQCGFIEGIEIDAATFLNTVPELFAREPINFIHFRNVSAASLKKLFDSPVLEGLVGLDFAGNQLGNEGVEALAASPRLGQLQWLGLHGNYVGLKGANALATSTSLANLRYLHFDGNRQKITRSPKTVDENGLITEWELPGGGLLLRDVHGEKPWMQGWATHISQHPPRWHRFVTRTP